MWILFEVVVVLLLVVFVRYGMDIRKKPGARSFVWNGWQVLMKACSFSLIVAFVAFIAVIGITSPVHEMQAADWLGLVVMLTGTACVMAAKRALGRSHTFTGEYLERPKLVTWGIYRFTRNPLYLGVFLCEVGASMVVVGRAPTVWPQAHLPWLAVLALPLIYAIAFNLSMAFREARYLRRYFGEDYLRYSEAVPFLVPSIRPRTREQTS